MSVLPVYAWLDDRWLLALINLAPDVSDVQFHIPDLQTGALRDLLDATRACEPLEAGASSIALGPWGCALLELDDAIG
jgi:hypothetical protein